MLNERNDGEKVDEVILPGFRFHPTDEELVGFYLKRKVQQKPLSIELIRPINIYKYDPWDLPKLATTGEKEWYFYCPRDRKYRNSARPNRVTGAGFWKATGTDRPIYSSEGSKCIGLKKSLVFYKGRAAKGTKTDWMMHEFRLPSVTDTSLAKRPIDKNIPIDDSWAICRIFKKMNSMAHRALPQSWLNNTPLIPEKITDSAADAFSISCSTDVAGGAFNNDNIYPTLESNYSTIRTVISGSTTAPPFPVGNPTADLPFSSGAFVEAKAPTTLLPPTVFGDVQYCRLQPWNGGEVPDRELIGGDLSVVGREIMCMRKRHCDDSSHVGSNGLGSNGGFVYDMRRPTSMLINSDDCSWRYNASTGEWDQSSPSCPSDQVSPTYQSTFAGLD